MPLAIVPNKFVVRYETAPSRLQADGLLNNSRFITQHRWRDAKTAIISASSLDLEALRNNTEAIVSNPLYTIAGNEAILTEEFAVKYLSTTSQAQIDALAKQTGSRVKWTNKAGLVLLAVSTGGNALTTANTYQESGLVEFAHPNFLMDVKRSQVIPNDEYFPRQFYLRNTGQLIADGHRGRAGADINASPAWSLTQGSNNITIAIAVS